MNLNPSHADTWMNCPGSVRESERYPVVETDYKLDGIAAHKVLQTCIVEKYRSADRFLNLSFTVNEVIVPITSKMIDSVNKVLDYIHDNMNDDTIIGCEVAVDPASTLCAGLNGAIDVVLIQPIADGTFDVEIIDFKDGYTPVFAEDNWQLVLYAWGIRSLYPQVRFSNFKLTIVQPNAALKGLSINNSVTLTIVDLLRTHGRIMKAVEDTKEPNAPLMPGAKQCHWCRAKGGCRAFADMTTKGTGLSVNIENIAQQAVDNDPIVLSNDQLREIFEAAPMIRKMLDSVEEEIMRRFEQGLPVDGVKIVKGVGRKSWAFDEVEMATKLNKMGIPKDMVFEKKLLSFNKACELKWKKRNDEVVSLSKRQIETLEKEYIKKGDGRNMVALESDPRPAVELSVNHLFKPIETPAPAALPDWI